MASAADQTKRLLRSARGKSDDGRRQLLAICGDLLSGESTVLTSLEYALMRDILGRLVEELAAPLRLALGQRLGEFVPGGRVVAASLAAEPIDLTAPLLLGADGAIDLQLVETVRNRAFEHRLMLAMRRSQADPGNGILLPGEDAIGGLLHFPDPAIPDLAMAYLVDQSRRFDPFLEPVVRAEELSADLRRKLTIWLLAGMRHHIEQRHRIDGTRLDDAVEAVAAAAPAAEVLPTRNSTTVLARHLGALGAVTGPLMLQVLRQGEVALFAALLAETARLRADLVRRLLFEPGGDGLAVICRATDLGRPVLASMFLLTRRARPSERAAGPGELSQVVALYDRIDPKAARGVLAHWRRDRDFLTALRFIEEAANEMPDQSWPPLPALFDPVRMGNADLTPTA